ncbi:prepilin-type N-terminal cleavage/methylation domain-containing protein [Aliiglaciecola sp. LCG003]|uniref:prepilin-type N-terminal cleavage/methylation domain-containing protein n=1 Tax=Aliiglaciecola sp. LCG003 TaxID=3053655 RepID=UPI00257467E7|nr:prepilin-type N-terminal cleavage/methylation domain-containing protein [Aliiglaciecola sp. LCG003]WJG09710.1 prepilin-type N-terminal cleavage/methylation domain-containing protein [Aliiglaciecola sp. LCG003]
MQQRGFTLIELIIVIVILGILAVTAAPRFIDLSSDAKASTLKGVKAALQGGAQLVYAKSSIAGEQTNANAGDDTSRVTIGTVDVDTDFGYPDADSMNAAMLAGWVQLDVSTDGDFSFTPGADPVSATNPAEGTFAISPAGGAVDFTSGATTGRCYVLYADATDTSAPVVTVVDDDC